MLTVEQKEIIRREFFIHRKSMRQIAREMHHSRKTIRKAIYDAMRGARRGLPSGPGEAEGLAAAGKRPPQTPAAKCC